MKNSDIIIVGMQPWDIKIGSSCKCIANEFAANNRVLYVNPPLTRVVRIRMRNDPAIQKRIRIIKGQDEGFTKERENLWVLYPKMIAESINWIPVNAVFDCLNRINNRRFAKEIRKAAQRLGFKNYLIFNDGLMFGGRYLKEYLRPDKCVYYLRDNFLAGQYFVKHGARIQGEIMREADSVVVNSPYLLKYAEQYNKRAFFVGQGAGTGSSTEYKDIGIPGDLKPVKKPVIGYAGTLTALRLDIELIAFISKQRPEWSLVLVGPEDDSAFRNSELHSIKNIYFLGRKDPREIQFYIKGFDVCINPQLVNPVTEANYPLKIDEYLAAGKPIVAARTSTMTEIFSEYVCLASGKEEFVQGIEKALSADNEKEAARRRAFAATHTWAKVAARIYQSIGEVENSDIDGR